MPSIRKNRNTWIMLAIAIFLGIIIYYFFYRNNTISAFQSQQLCPYSAATEIIKYKSGKFPELTSSTSICALLSDGDFWSVIPSQTPVFNTYMNLLSEASIIKKFLDTGRNSSGDYVLVQTPSTNQKAFNTEIGLYITAILDGVTAVKDKLTASDTALLSTVTGILAKYGTDSQIIKDNGSITEYIKSLPINYSNKTPEQVIIDILSYFKSFDIAPGCDNQMTVLDITGNYDNILDFTYVLKLLYSIVKTKYTTNGTPALTFAMLKAATDAYTVIKTYYLNPMNAFTGYNRNSYASDDEYMSAIILNINNVIVNNIASDGKIKTTTNKAEDILYNNVKFITDKCTSISGNSTCYTPDIKNMCDKLKYIREYTGSIENIDVVGYTLPTVLSATTTTTSAGGTTTTSAGGTTTTSAGGTTTTSAGGTTTTSAGGTTTTKGPMIFDLASQLDYQKFLDDLSVLFTGRTGDPSEVVNTLLNLNQEQRNSICSTYCNGLYTECTDICRLAKCENCTGGVDNTLTGAGRPATGSGYSNYNTLSYNLLDNISDNQLGLGYGGQGGTSSHVGPMLYQKDGDGISNIFAPYVLVQPAATSSGAGYSSFMLNNPNDPLYKAYLSQLIADYNASQ